MTPTDGMPLTDAVGGVYRARLSSDVVITAMGAAREWMALDAAAGEANPLDFVFVPSSMGQATSLGLGVALAQPRRRVIVMNGDGSTLMNLGSLVSITAAAPRNLTLVVLDNGVYEVTGAQPTPGAPAGRTAGAGAGRSTTERVDFAGLARASGFRSVFTFTELGAWSRGIKDILAASGPTFVLLEVEPVSGGRGPRSPGPAGERARRFMAALQDQVDK